MGDSETVVAHTSTVMDYTSTVYPSRFYMDASATPVAGVDASSAGPNAMEATFYSNPISDKSNTDTNFVVQEANYAVDGNKQLHAQEDVNQINPGIQTSFLESSQPTVCVTNSNEGLDNCAKNSLPADNGVNTATLEHQLSDGPVFSTEAERLWSIVKANSADFTAWTLLIDETERTSLDNVMSIRKVYDTFLAEFPLCYGYWKKYADHESRFGATDKVMEVYERAVQGVTYSVEIWLHYCVFAISTHGDPDRIRRLFERGLAYVGTDYLSYPLWDKYIEYEYTLQQWSRLAAIYSRILKNPNQQLDHYFTCFKQLVGSQPLSELKTAESVSSPDSYSVANAQEIEGEVQVHSEGIEESSEPLSSSLTEVEEKEQYVSIREEAYKRAKEFDSKIVGFETAIRRPYFHVRPLVDAELENWHNYIDFIEREEDSDKLNKSAAPFAFLAKPLDEATFNSGYCTGTKALAFNMCSIRLSTSNSHFKLYERCLIACANYPEYWKRYIMCMENCGRMDIAENALTRAAQVFVKRQPEIHLFAARFKEQHGDILGARAAYQLVHTEIAPGLLEAIIDHANMERRLGNIEGSFSLYEQAISIEKGKEQSQTLPLLYAQYSQFVYLVSGNVDKAREILLDALDEVQMSKPLVEALINLESNQSTAKQIEYLDSLVDKFITPDSSNLNVASVTERKELSGIYLEFLGLFGDVLSIKKATDRHNRLFLRNSCSSVSRKRDSEEILSSEREKLAKSYPAHTHWPVSFESESQTWPHVAHAQEQSWNPSYSQQVSAYPGYYGGNYTYAQVPTSVPQASAYGAYPPTYLTQAYPQQAYTTPPTVSATIPAQQPDAAAQQAYYGTAYY